MSTIYAVVLVPPYGDPKQVLADGDADIEVFDTREEAMAYVRQAQPAIGSNGKLRVVKRHREDTAD